MPAKKIPETKSSAADFMPEDVNLTSLRSAAAVCHGCELYKDATQTVFGEGPSASRLLFIGEQPGDSEDKAGRPFVGPAGRLLDRALKEAGIERVDCYFTNVVKHFKFEWRGKTRLHKKPRQIEITACLPWLNAEIALIKPKTIVLLGSTAAQSLFGKSFKVTEQRGQLLQSDLAPNVMATVHPSSILRAVDESSRRAEMELFVCDLKLALKIHAGS